MSIVRGDKNFQYKQSRGAIIANIPTAKQEGSSNCDQVAYDDSNDAVHDTSNMNAEGNAKHENVESSRERESGPPNLKASNLPTTNTAFSDSVLASSSKIPDGDAKQDRSPNPSELNVKSSNETGNEVADGDGDANQEGSSNLSEPNVESSKNGEDASNSKSSNLQIENDESDEVIQKTNDYSADAVHEMGDITTVGDKKQHGSSEPPESNINSDGDMPGAKFPVGTRVTVRCEFNPNYFLHGKVTRYDVGNGLYTAEFDEKDNADAQKYTSDELQKIVTKLVVGMKGILFVPYTGMSVFAFRGDNEVKAEIVQVYQKNAKLKWADDNLLSILCVPYNQIRPVSNNDKVKEQADEV